MDAHKTRRTCVSAPASLAKLHRDAILTSREGLGKLKKYDYKLAILNVMMPRPDGFEILVRIREEHCLPILMLTARADSLSKVRGAAGGSG